MNTSALPDDAQVAVADYGNHRVQIFDTHGRYLREIGGFGTGPGKFWGAAGVAFTRDGAAAAEFEHRASAGMVGVNVAIPVPVAAYAVQGWKNSAYGDTGLNNASWSFYTRPKYVTSRWESLAGTDFGFRPN